MKNSRRPPRGQADRVGQLEREVALFLEQKAAHQQQIAALNTRLQQATARSQLLEKRLIMTRASTTYQIGYQLRIGASSLLGLLRLPAALFKLYRLARNRRKARAPHKDRYQEPVAHSLPAYTQRPRTPPPVPVADADYIRHHLLIGPGERNQPSRIACVLDTFSYEVYKYEANLLQLTPADGLAELQGFQPDMLFVESAWRGKDDLWRNKVAHTSAELRGLLQWCKLHRVPTVFWNKEDPVHFDTFIGTAQQFDRVFTTDIDCIARYKSALGHDRVYCLPFACQPAVHNPIELYERKDAFCFAGAYYVRYPERTHDLMQLTSGLTGFRDLEIFDRNANEHDANYQYPAEYQRYIVGSLPAHQIDQAYKGYRYAINLNSIKHSQSMFARRVFELLGSNTLTVSNFSRGLRALLGDTVICTDSSEQMLRRLDAPGEHAKLRLAGLRKVMLEHTYAHRLSYVMSKVTGSQEDVPLPSICLVAAAADEAQLQALVAHLQRQRYANVTLYVAVNGWTPRILGDSRVRLVGPQRLDTLTLDQLASGAEWLGAMVAEDYYGPHYLLDLALATRYSKAQVVGKVAHYAVDAQGIHLRNPGQEYRRTGEVAVRRALLDTSLLNGQPVLDWLKNLPTRSFVHPQSLAIDAYNYCENAASSHPQHVNEVVNDVDLYTGMSLHQLQRSAEALPAHAVATLSPQTSGRELAEHLGPLRSKCLHAQIESDTWHIRSTLADDKHEYHYARQDMSATQLGVDGGVLKLLLDATPGLNLQVVVLFLDAQKQRISHVMQQANGNLSSDLPPETVYLRLGLRVYGSGTATIKALVHGNRATLPATPLAKARCLLVTNHYPSYDDLYRNGFVHTRVTAYQRQGLAVDVFRLRQKESISYHEFENIDVITGPATVLANMLASGSYTSVLVHVLDPQMWEILSAHIARLQVIVWVHGAEIQPWWRRAHNYCNESQRQLAKLSSERRMVFWRDLLRTMPSNLQLVFVSRQFAEEAMDDLGFRLPQSQYRIIHNPIDTHLFSYGQKPLEQRKKILSIRPYVSRTYANDLSVKAIQQLAKKPWFNELEFLLVGDGPLFEETLAPLRQYPNIKIEKRYLKHAEIAELHKHYGVFLCPSRMDTQGVSRDEAMASGLVPVTNRVGAIPEFVDNTCGFLAAPESFSELSEGIETLFLNPDIFRAKSLSARQRVVEQRDMQLISTSELSLIRESRGEPKNSGPATQHSVDAHLVRTSGR